MFEAERTNITAFSPTHRHDRRPAEHAWLVPHLISLIGYAERHGLTEVEHALASAAERIAPSVLFAPEAVLPGAEHRLVRLRHDPPDPAD